MRAPRPWILVSCLIGVLGLAGCGGAPSETATPGPAHETAAPEATAPTAAAGSGGLEGRVLYDGQAPEPTVLKVTKDTAVCARGKHFDRRLVVGPEKGIQYSVVSIQGVAGGKPLTDLGAEFVLNQEGCSYDPHVLLVPVDTPLQIFNHDGILHNIHTYSTDNETVNIAQPKFRKKIETTFTKPERVSVKCDVHGWMSAWIYVVDHPYHAVTGADGSFAIEGIPPGTYQVTSWQESQGEQTTTVTIEADAVAKVEIHYPG